MKYKPDMPDMPDKVNGTHRTHGTRRTHGILAALLFLLTLAAPQASAQITIGGNVYGGGNQGNTGGNTTVTVKTCEVHGNVFGGARMADVDGRAFVHIDGEHASGEIKIKAVYGGNDIAGTVGKNVDPTLTTTAALPAALTEVGTASGKNDINDSWSAFVRTSKTATENTTHRIVVGSVFGGGNGDYTYTTDAENGDYIVKDGDTEIARRAGTAFTAPTLSKTYLELTGGCLAHIFGGGNNATVTGNTTICINNSSTGLQGVLPAQNEGESASAYQARLLADFMDLASYVDLSTFQGNYTDLNYNAARVFGGNNKVAMAIRPVWNLQQGLIRDLYSGGNEGDMTSSDGLILDIDPLPANSSNLRITNVYGGCRRADVRPLTAGGTIPASVQLPDAMGYKFPAGFSARTIVRGGHITNVYGGNDISGHVFGGNAVGIYTTVYGDVYGGGNGSYAYTDNATLGAMTAFRDYYYDPEEVKQRQRDFYDSGFEYSSSAADVQSVEALNLFRPNAEEVSLRVKGEEDNPTIIKGAVYLGGNSASLKTEYSSYVTGTPRVEIKIGSYSYCDKLFLGNNGENMVDETLLHRYAGYLNAAGETVDSGTSANDFSQMDLTDAAIFAKYMDGCAMSLKPRIVFDNEENGDPHTYDEYTGYIGSFYCGGNVGSMTWPGTNTLDIDQKVIVYDKFVGGCNRANVAASTYNAAYHGGMIGDGSSMVDGEGNIKDCLVLNFNGLKIQPKRWKDDSDPTLGLEWNTFDNSSGLDVDAPAISGDTESTDDDINRRLRGGNIYGGCYESGHINGNVVINLLDTIIDKHIVFDVVEKASSSLYENDTYTIKTRNSGVILDEQGMDPLGMALNVFGGGYGKDSEVWGSTTVNLNAGYTFQIFGGGQQGPVGKSNEDIDGSTEGDYEFNGKHYNYDARYSTYVNLNSATAASASAAAAETEFIYGGSFEAPIIGNTRVNLGNGRIFNSFAGSCNADILGHTETYVGQGFLKDGTLLDGFPYVRDHIYGGNDLGGSIKGEGAFLDSIRSEIRANVYSSATTTNASAYIRYRKGHVVNIYGGCYGVYDYTDAKYRDYCNADGSNKAGFTKPRMDNAFVHFAPVSVSNTNNGVANVFGAGEGQSQVIDRDVMQRRSYILVDIPQNMTTFQNMEVFGAGSFSGLGMEQSFDDTKATVEEPNRPNLNSAVIDLFRGQIKNAYGGSYQEGITRRSVVNVPTGSTIYINNIFGGAFGVNNRYPCDVYESVVNFNSKLPQVSGGIYGGNNNARRTLYTQVNINDSVLSNRASNYQGYAYGAGYGPQTWAEYTEVNINDGGVVYKVYGGGYGGQVYNQKTLEAIATAANADADDSKHMDLSLGTGYTDTYLASELAKYSELADDVYTGDTYDAIHRQGATKEKFNTNVHIRPGGVVTGYAYGAGRGTNSVVSGTTYGDVLGGTVDRDFYAGGEGGMVKDSLSLKTFTATSNLYVKSGTVRNAYGGGFLGSVGYHDTSTNATTTDVDGQSNVVIGKLTGTGFADGVPTVTRNAYGSGEGGSIFGRAQLTINNGYVGYRYNASGTDNVATPKFDERYEEELDDPGQDTPENAIVGAGNAYGGGYVINSFVDTTYVYMYGGHLRGSIYGGGELGPVGRGTKEGANDTELDDPVIHKGGSTHVYLYGGHVHRDVFGGGRGEDSWGGDGSKFLNQWFTAEEIRAMDFYSKGFVYGNTETYIRGGEIGTAENVADGHGNVFGGGDIGYVYSATGQKVGSNPEVLRQDSENNDENGLPTDGGGYYYKNGNIHEGMTVDCYVDVAPYCQVTAAGGITFNEFSYDSDGNIVQTTAVDADRLHTNVMSGGTRTFAQGEYVPVDYLNLLGNKEASSTDWAKLDLSGIIIHNAVFAGGNVSVGSDQIFVNSNTVFGNATAALRDIYHRDLITIGTEHTGGLYGDGNLTFVDGFRELNISNYGTDFYGLSDNITIEEYHSLNDRERAYFELKYECQSHCTDKNGTEYDAHATLTAEEYADLFDGTNGTSAYTNETYWKEAGFCSIYAGRLLNTIQRADMVGVWGSRMVLQGARDRVPEKADYTNYTINRVGEVSLNRVKSQYAGDTQEEDRIHGNYFGIYSIVNYLGNLTSDVFFDTPRTSSAESGTSNAADGTTTYYQWKNAHKDKNNRNNGSSLNKVALASGVYLEITREEGEATGETVWGHVTGVIQLDLINVMQGLGGGYVYAKNEHGAMTWHSDWGKVTLSPFNRYARTHRRFTYATPTSTDDIETSGNFIHNVKQIVDDCYPTTNSYTGAGAAPAHYWYIKGSIYVYDQYISAYTGSATAYSQNISIPLTISAASHGKLTLREVQPNYYAYYDASGNKLGDAGADETFEANGVHYSLNDPITYWDYEQLSSEEKSKFVKETYTVIEKCKIGDTEYAKGAAMLPEDYEDLMASSPTAQVYDAESETYRTDPDKPASYLVRLSNNVSHDTGYVLTYDIDNPMSWNNWYTKNDDVTQSARKNTDDYKDLPAGDKANYTEGPTYRLTTETDGVYGQQDYNVGDIITNRVYDTYMDIPSANRTALTGQATFEEAYVVTQELTVVGDDDSEHHIYPGVAIAHSDFDTNWSSISSKVALANIVTSTLKLADNEYLYAGDLLTDAEKASILATYFPETPTALDEYVAKAYYCSAAGKYGGNLFQRNTPYRAVDAWCSMSAEDREDFTFNYDALDLLVDPTYSGVYGSKAQYDGTNDPKIYTAKTPVDYQAKYVGTSNLTYTKADGTTTVTIHPNDTLSREDYEAVPNERYHYAPITVTAPGNYYIVKDAFIRGDMPYTVGETISETVYNSLNTNQKACIDILDFKASHCNTPTVVDGQTVYEPKSYYYCREAYTVNEHGEGHDVTTAGVKTATTVTYTTDQTVPRGIVIDATNYSALVNKTSDGTNLLFTVIGNTPMETSTLYVSRESDIFDLSKEKVITVIYLYEYEESDGTGLHISPVSERHIVNIHLQFKSGVPEIGQLSKPTTVLPGSTVGLKVPNITPGAFEVLSSGWEIFTNSSDATSHKNGQPYVNNGTPMYWYQDGYWVAYYAKTYLGKTYSNSVEFSVANYHDLDKVMQDKTNHMYVDHKDVKRDPKIYIDNRACLSDPNKNELDLLKDFFDLTLQERQFNTDEQSEQFGQSVPIATSGALNGHHGISTSQIGASKNLEFFLRSDMSPKAYTTWTPIGSHDGDCSSSEHCFDGTLHGDGYTISGLSNSLFHNLCGNIYNLGVTGTFTSAGIVETGKGYLENCWIMSTAAAVDNTTKAVFGNPSDNTGTQIVNCYYPATNAYSETPHARGNARKMPLSSFYNGEVTYNLNGFYLQKRYADRQVGASGNMPYTYFRANANGTLPASPSEGYYTNDYAIYPLDASTKLFGYVENRYADGDFIYAGGSIPESKNVRFYEDTGSKGYYPIWPDDYLFFGQRLTYGYADNIGRPHQALPTTINKFNTRLTATSADINRVYRAPAYFRSKTMGVAHYNPYAVFAQTKSGDATTLAYPNMTAIDFTGYDDTFDGATGDTKAYGRGLQAGGFFPPLLDNDGLEYLRNADLTKNWLVYTPEATDNAADADSKTNDVVLDYLTDAAYSETNATYRTVASRDVSGIHGHAVVNTDEGYIAPFDHLLVDRQDFNAPIGYTMNSGKRMWYQRVPTLYAGQKKYDDTTGNVNTTPVLDSGSGWEGISLPFAAEVVTTNQKGELTHFYGTSLKGHEYWLREYDGNLQQAKDAENNDIPNVYTASFNYPAATSSAIAGLPADKTYTNDFLWDYYYQYSSNDRQDKNTDTYQQQYYKADDEDVVNTYEDYGYSVAAAPYLIGFPGARYYEFDLSGSFEAKNTLQTITKLGAQTITFASPTGISVAVSDDELATATAKVNKDGYIFTSNYLRQDLAATTSYALNNNGNSYVVVTTDGGAAAGGVTVDPFRPYFTTAPSGVKHRGAEAIAFSNVSTTPGSDEQQPDLMDMAGGELIVKGKRGRILVTSKMPDNTAVHIVNAAGAVIRTFDIAPGQTIETNVAAGVYIVNKTKISIR